MEFEYLCHHIIMCAELMFGKRLLAKTIKLLCRLAFSSGVRCMCSLCTCARTFNVCTSKCKCTKNSSASTTSSSSSLLEYRYERKWKEVKSSGSSEKLLLNFFSTMYSLFYFISVLWAGRRSRATYVWLLWFRLCNRSFVFLILSIHFCYIHLKRFRDFGICNR